MAQMAALTAFSPNTTILSADTNGNNTTIRNTYNAHDIATSSVHGITSPSIIVGSDEVQTVKNKLLTSLGDVRGLSITLSTGVLAFKSYDGITSLSSTNKGVVPCPSTTAGRYVELSVTSNISINDLSSGSSGLTGVTFGVTSGINWLNDMPWFFYVVNKGNTDINGVDGNSAFFLSRCPNYKTTPTAAYIGKTGTAPATDDQFSIVLMGSGYVTSTYASLPCRCLGSLRARYTAASTDWTFTALGNTDGFGLFNDETLFAFPSGQMGATSGKFLDNNGGTAPVFSTNIYLYKLSRNGICFVDMQLSGDGGTDGAGAQAVKLAIPYKLNIQSTQAVVEYIYWQSVPSALAGPCQLDMPHNLSVVTMYRMVTATTVQQIINSDFPNGNRSLQGRFNFNAF